MISYLLRQRLEVVEDGHFEEELGELAALAQQRPEVEGEGAVLKHAVAVVHVHAERASPQVPAEVHAPRLRLQRRTQRDL
eukprot:6313898-Pyramimonas_sp.AAC.1